VILLVCGSLVVVRSSSSLALADRVLQVARFPVVPFSASPQGLLGEEFITNAV